MPFGPDVETGTIAYNATIQHNGSGLIATIALQPIKVDGTPPTEETANQVFQAFLNKMAELPNVTILSAVKTGTITSQVTVTP